MGRNLKLKKKKKKLKEIYKLGDTLFIITINYFREEKRYTVYGRKNNFIDLLFETDKSRELVNWYNEGWNNNV